MKSILKLIAGPVYKRYSELLRRIHDLEVALDAMILRPVWVNDPNFFLNGQKERLNIFNEIHSNFDITEIIETGTFLGDTTGFFAHTLPNVPVMSCELMPRFCGLAKARLKNFSNVTILCTDSRTFLSQLEEDNSESSYQVSFVYLDAHWNSDLPLRDELNIISSKRRSVIIMIDDFKVPNDVGYAFDNYGAGKELSLENFDNDFKRHGLQPFFPVASSRDETGYRRGCVVLGPKGKISDKINSMQSLCMR